MKNMGKIAKKIVGVVVKNMSLIKKEMNLILNNLRSLKAHQVGEEILSENMLAELLETEFDEFMEKTKDKDIKVVLRNLRSKCREVKKLLKFSKTQILYDKNLKMM